MWEKLKSIFITGLLIFIPLSATLLIIYYSISFLEGLFLKTAGKFIGYFPGMGLIFLIAIILLLGVIGRFAFGQKVIEYLENTFRKIPILRTIYEAVKEATKAMLTSEAEKIKGVVLIEYPRKGVYAIGFTTGKSVEEACKAVKKELINVFIPTSPNPTSGIVLLVPKEEVTFLDMSVEDAMKIIISGGFSKL